MPAPVSEKNVEKPLSDADGDPSRIRPSGYASSAAANALQK